MSIEENKHKQIIGYSTNKFLLMDIDHSTLLKVENLAKLIQKCYGVGDALILQSSDYRRLNYTFYPYPIVQEQLGSYHIVFGKRMNYDKIVSIIETFVDLGYFDKTYLEIRKWRQDLTLRISRDNSEDKPRQKPIIKKIVFTPNGETYRDYEGILDYMKFYDVV